VHSKNIWGRPLAEAILIAAAVLILLGIAFGVLRLILGRTTVDRVAAIDMLTVISISLIALYAHVAGRSIYLDVALVYGVLSFLAVLAVARYLERGV
jgi:multicomponent Na+:H+ antiporter subunit F